MSEENRGLPGVQAWFQAAVPKPTAANLRVQLGCHLEEVSELLDSLATGDGVTLKVVGELQMQMSLVSRMLKAGSLHFVIQKPEDFLDAIADQIVTGVGLGHMVGAQVPEALERVNTSNWTKFVDGKPVFDEHGKIAKGPGYKKADMKGLI